MFDFEKLELYKRAKRFNKQIRLFLKSTNIDSVSRNQLLRASLSIVLNIAEGSGRFSSRDKRNFYIISRSSLIETISILDILKDEGGIEDKPFEWFYSEAEELSKIMFKLINDLAKGKEF